MSASVIVVQGFGVVDAGAAAADGQLGLAAGFSFVFVIVVLRNGGDLDGVDFEVVARGAGGMQFRAGRLA